MTGLSEEQLEIFDKEGMICLPNFLSSDQISQLLTRSHQLLDEFDISNHPLTQFKTNDNDHVGDEYFFNSSDKIGYFFDTDAFNDSTGKLNFPIEQAINKIGHGLHMIDPVFEQVTLNEDVRGIMKSLKYVDPRILQSMLIFKQPIVDENVSKERSNAVPPHTDGTFLYTEPQSAVGFWFALEDCTIENGCLSYLPGSHKVYPITKRFVKINKGKEGCNFINVGDETEVKTPPKDGYKIVECKAGSLILINNSVLHKSENNRSKKSRFAYAFHIIDGVAKYDELNWLQVPPNPDGGTQFTKLF
ncbi:hypothetical protein DFJ63DRAFT_219152 [Scheffersomyces coipomensis]|uniref:uncharacterized protein n=1 Tax=Scheffersomyces coipomensis TaxID=1788519 RepID=UPI00315DD4E4